MRKNATKLAAAVLSLAMVMTSVSMPASAATTKKAKLNKTKATLYTNGTKTTTLKVLVGKKSVKATFKSSNTKILTVGKTTGKVTAKKNGTATVTATYKKKAYKCKITVKTYATSITSSTKTINLEVGKTATIKKSSVKVLPSTASNKTFNFTSSNKSVATVGLTGGKVTAKKKGTAKIYVTALGSKGKAKKATITVNVTEPDVTPTETPSVTPGVTETPVPTETPSVATEGTISVTTNITGASIKVLDGTEVVAEGVTDGTPFTTKVLPAGTYTIVISKDGFEDVTKNVIVNGDVNENIELVAGVLNVASIKAVNALGEKTDLDGATVSRASSFELTLDRAFDTASVTNSTIKIVKGSETMAISLPTIDKGVIAFKPLSVLDADTEYTIVVDGIKSEKGTAIITNKKIATFKTTNTVVTKKITANGQKIYDTTTDDGVSLNVAGDWRYGEYGSHIEVKFDTPVDKSTINSQSVQLIDVTNGKNIAVEANQNWYSESMYIQVVGAKDYLTPKHQYKLVLSGLKAANGADIDVFSITFAYKADAPKAVDTADIYNGDLKKVSNTLDGLVNPLTTSKMLDDGSTFKAAAAVTVDFGAAEIKLDESTVTTDYLYIREKDTHNKVEQKISYNKELNRVTLTPTKNLKDDTEYEIFESPYIKNIYGVKLGTKDSDYKTKSFKTLDVTAPTVVGQPESTLENKSLTSLPLDNNFKINVKMSEKVNRVSLADDAKSFATGGCNGNILITRADDETKVVTAGAINLGKDNGITVDNPTIGKDGYIQLSVNPTKLAELFKDDKDEESGIKGKTFRVTLAGTNPSRKNDLNKVITDLNKGVTDDKDNKSVNAMANDYSFTFTFEGEDKTAPKITDIKVLNDKQEYKTIQGRTNVKLNNIRVYFDSKDVPSTFGDNKADNIAEHIKLYKNSTAYDAKVLNAEGTDKGIKESGSTSFVDIEFTSAIGKKNVVEGSVTIKAQDIEDKAGNKSSLQTYDFVAGNGPQVSSAKFVTETGLSADSYVKIEASKDIDSTTLAGNIKLMNGDKEVKTTIDASKLLEEGIIKLIPADKLSGNTKYTLVVSKEVKNNDGNRLEQTTGLEPADYKVDLTTDDDAKPAIKGEPVYKDGKLTISLDTKVATCTSVSVSSPTTDAAIKYGASVASNGTDVEVTFDKLLKNVQYDVTITVSRKESGINPSIIVTKFVAPDDYTKVPASKLQAGVGSSANEDDLVSAEADQDGKFTLVFDNPVAVSAIKGLTITNIVTGKEYTPDVAYDDGRGSYKDTNCFDKDGNGTTEKDKVVYAKEFTVDIPGYYKDPTEFRFTLSKGTEFLNNTAKNISSNDIKFVIKTQIA